MTGEEQEEGRAGTAVAERERGTAISRWAAAFLNGAGMLAAITAAAILVETLLLPVLQIYGSSMEPALHEGDYVIALRYAAPGRGDVVAFYNNSKILVKRVIALPGEQVALDEDGRVYINGEQLDEPYLEKTAFGGCDIGLPCQVPEGKVFVMGDNRRVSVDSRNSSVGFVSKEQLIGKLVFRVWPRGMEQPDKNKE